jgi:Ribbon-helix-helix protein, copG family
MVAYSANMRRERKKTEQFAARLTDDCARLLEALADRKGVTRGSIVEMAVRDYAAREGITIAGLGPKPAKQPDSQAEAEGE